MSISSVIKSLVMVTGFWASGVIAAALSIRHRIGSTIRYKIKLANCALFHYC